MSKTYAVVLRRLRKANRMSLSDVSDRTGVSRAQISEIENGKVDPRVSTVVKLLDCYGADFADLSRSRRIDVSRIRQEADRAAEVLEKVGLGPSDPEERLSRKEARGVDTTAERAALVTRQ